MSWIHQRIYMKFYPGYEFSIFYLLSCDTQLKKFKSKHIKPNIVKATKLEFLQKEQDVLTVKLNNDTQETKYCQRNCERIQVSS